MNRHQVNILVKRRLGFPFKRAWVRNIIRITLDMESVKHPLEAGVVFTDDHVMCRLNKRYRNIDSTTDVLSFSLLDDIRPVFNTYVRSSSKLRIMLGEIIISYPTAVKQANSQGCEIEQELIMLLVHGVLHLLGYNHEEAAEARRMEDRETAIVKIIGGWKGK